jgi:hypothetical protein
MRSTGATSGSVFTSGQANRMMWCMGNRWGISPFMGLGTAYALHSWHLNFLPFDQYTISGNNGIINWTTPVACGANMPSSCDILVTTYCDENAQEYQLLYHLNDINSPFAVPLDWGIKTIQFTYWYGGQINIITRTINTPPTNTSPCTAGDPEGKPSGINVTKSESKAFRIINNTSSSILSISNIGYKFITIYDVAGNRLHTSNLSNGTSAIDVSGLASGLYIIKASDGVHEIHERFRKL